MLNSRQSGASRSTGIFINLQSLCSSFSIQLTNCCILTEIYIHWPKRKRPRKSRRSYTRNSKKKTRTLEIGDCHINKN